MLTALSRAEWDPVTLMTPSLPLMASHPSFRARATTGVQVRLLALCKYVSDLVTCCALSIVCWQDREHLHDARTAGHRAEPLCLRNM